MATYFDEDLWYGNSAESEAAAEQKAAKSIAAKVGRIIGAKPFPIAAQRLSELTRDPYCPMQVVVDVLESDPALSARLLRLVNSAGYTLRTSCTSVGHAAALVGIRKLNQIASTAAILDLYDTNSEIAAATLEHAAIVGALCRYLAAHVGLPPDELFTCGFLHDIGKLMLLESEGEEYGAILRLGLDEPDSVHIKERALLGYDHALLAGHVLSAWHIPAPVPKVVAWHHQVARAYQEGTEIGRMVSVVRFADAMSVALFRQFPDFEVERLARTEAASYLEISEPQIAAMWDECFVLAQRARATFRGEPAPAPEDSAEPSAPEPANDTTPLDAAPSDTGPFKQPLYFPCVACGVPSYANVCSACNGYVCPSHQDAADEWCSLCVQEYSELELRLPPWLYAVLGSAIGAMLVGTLVGAAGAVTGRPLKLMVAPGLLALLVVVLTWSWQRFFRRLWFVRTCPNRRSMVPAKRDQAMSDIPEGAVLSKRWINPFELGARGPVVRELYEELEPFPHRVPSSLPPPKSERRVSLRPSRRDPEQDLPPVFSLTPPMAAQRVDADPPVTQRGRAAATSPNRDLPAQPSAAQGQAVTIRSRANSVKPKPPKAKETQEPMPKKQGTPSKRTSAASRQLSQRPRTSFRPQAEITILELDAFDAPEPVPVSTRSRSDLIAAQQAATQRPGSKSGESSRRGRSLRAPKEPKSEAKSSSPAPLLPSETPPQDAPLSTPESPPTVGTKSRRTRAKAPPPAPPPESPPEETRVTAAAAPKARVRKRRERK